MQALFLLVVLSVPSWAGTKVYECRGKDGRTRLTNRACAADETVLAEKALAPAGQERWTVVDSLYVESWDKERGWYRVRSTSRLERDTVRRAVDEFNRLEGLGLKLDYTESDGPEASLNSRARAPGRIMVKWADDAAKGTLPSPYFWRGKSYVTMGGADLAPADAESLGEPRPGVNKGKRSRGGTLYMVAFSERIQGLYKCKEDGPIYVTLHELGHVLGLGHATPAPSIMHGTCGTAYLPNDLAGFKYSFGTH